MAVPGPLLLAAILLTVTLLPAPLRAGPSEDLERAERAYERTEFKLVIRLLGPLLSPQILFSTQKQALQAHRLLGLSHLFEQNRAEAERQFLAMLSLRPDYRLDPLLDPVAAVELFEEVKRKNAQMVQRILERERLERERLERERRQREEERARQEAERRRQESQRTQSCVTIERTVVERPFWVSFVPFGAGQFQNGHRIKGFVLLGMEAGLGALSLGTALGLRVAYPDGRVSGADFDRAQALAVTQVVSGGLFFAVLAYGIIDAVVYHEPRTVTVTQTPSVVPRLTPAVTPEGAGLGLGWTF